MRPDLYGSSSDSSGRHKESPQVWRSYTDNWLQKHGWRPWNPKCSPYTILKSGLWYIFLMKIGPFIANGLFKRKMVFEWKHDNWQGVSCSKSFSLIHGIDCEETFGQLLCLSQNSDYPCYCYISWFDYEIWLKDIKTVFLNGKLVKGCTCGTILRLRTYPIARRYASFKGPFMGWSKHKGVGTCALMKR